MAHKTLVGGTAYEISGGKTLVNGTVYNIKNGKTLVGGTAYEVGFGCEIFIDVDPARLDDFMAVCGTVKINGVQYNSSYSDTTLFLPEGTVVTCSVAARGVGNTATVTVNGTVVAEVTATSSNSTQGVYYEYIVSTNATIRLTGRIGERFLEDLTSYVIITEE